MSVVGAIEPSLRQAEIERVKRNTTILTPMISYFVRCHTSTQ